MFQLKIYTQVLVNSSYFLFDMENKHALDSLIYQNQYGGMQHAVRNAIVFTLAEIYKINSRLMN